MRNITVDFSQRPPLISDKYAGEIGEHQAVTLNIIPETNMSDDTDIAFYYVLFKVEGGLVASRTFSQGEDISIALWGQLLEDRRLTFQLIGTNGLESIISKSPILTLYLGDSLEGTVIGIDDNRDSLIAMIGAFNERLDEVEQDVIYKPETANDGDALIYNATEGKWDAESRVKNISGMTGNEIRAAWNRGDDLMYVDTSSSAKIVKVRNMTVSHEQGVCVSYFRYDNLNNVGREYIRSAYIPNTSTTVTNLSALTRYGVTEDERLKLSGGAVESENSSFVTGGQTHTSLQSYYTKTEIDNKGYLTSIPTATTSTLGGVKVDGSTITINDGVISTPYAAPLDISGMTGNEIRAAWTAGKALCYSGSGTGYSYKASVISVMEDTIEQVTGVTCEIISYISTDVFINQIFAPNTSTTKTFSNGKRRVGIHPNEKLKLSGGSIASGNGSFVTGGQVYSEGYLKTIPTASTSTLGGVKVDGTSITINDGVISAQGGGGASAFIATFSVESDELVCDKTIHEIVTAYNSGNICLAKYTDEGGLGVELLYQINVAFEEEGYGLVEFWSYWDDAESGILYTLFGTNEGEGDSWVSTPRYIPSVGSIASGNTGYATGGDVYTALSSKQDTLTFDSTPTQNSNNPVTSGGLYTVIGNVESILAELIGGN